MRMHYRNGDPISLQANGCDGCNPSRINGVLCHESGCPEAWRDEVRECLWCETEFYPTEQHDHFCCPCCIAAYNGHECDCPECQYDNFNDDQDY